MTTEYVKAWQCIGCGRIDSPENCIGVCEYRKTEFVYAFDHEQVLAEAARARRRADALEAVVRQLARTTPHKGEWQHSYCALQEQARRALAAPTDRVPDPGAIVAGSGKSVPPAGTRLA